jgi:hypothetical protein
LQRSYNGKGHGFRDREPAPATNAANRIDRGAARAKASTSSDARGVRCACVLAHPVPKACVMSPPRHGFRLIGRGGSLRLQGG